MPGPDLLDQLLRLHGAEELGRSYLYVRLARYSVAGRLDYSEISRILSGIRRRADWPSAWSEAADRHEALARAAEVRRADVSTGDAYLRAALCHHWGSMFAEGDAKSAANARSVELYGRGSPYYRPPSHRVEIPFENDHLPAYVRMPPDVEHPPVILMIGGADTNKEELHHWGTELTLRGFCVVPFDGPGQGELSARYGKLTMRFDSFHLATRAVIDHLERTHPELDLDKVGIFGNSLGGYLGLDAALRDRRVKAVISNGGFADARSLDRWPRPVLAAFSSCLGITDPQEVADHIREHLDLAKVPRANNPAALVVHGGREDLSEEAEAAAAADIVGGSLLVVEDAWHTCTNRDHLVSAVFGDWLAAAIEDPTSVSTGTIRTTDETGYAKLFAPRS